MSFYESVFILRQDLTTDNAKSLCEKFSKVLEDSGGKIAKTEYWGLRNLSFKIKKKQKGSLFPYQQRIKCTGSIKNEAIT